MTVGTYSIIVEQGGAGSGSLGTRAGSQTVTSGNPVRIKVFDWTPVFQFVGVDAGLVFVGKVAVAIWSLP